MGIRRTPDLSEAQREIMEIIWERGELSVLELREILCEQRDVARETIRTLLGRMEEKGWVKHRVLGRTFFWSAVVPRQEGLGQRVVQLMEDLFEGSPERMVSALMDHRGLSDDEADRIQDMIDEARRPKRSKRRGKKS